MTVLLNKRSILLLLAFKLPLHVRYLLRSPHNWTQCILNIEHKMIHSFKYGYSRGARQSDPCRAVLTVADTRLLSVKVRWWGSHLRKYLEVRSLLRKVRGCLTTHTWMSPSWSSLYLMPLLLCRRLLLLQGPALWLLFPSGGGGCCADISPSRGLLSSDG